MLDAGIYMNTAGKEPLPYGYATKVFMVPSSVSM
tara:strand:+ start:171 stop:272 length:102 start_codon:yes stop_codon:yes gene_type:complete